MNYLLAILFVLPFLSCAILGILMWIKRYQSEIFYSRITVLVFVFNIVAFALLLGANLLSDVWSSFHFLSDNMREQKSWPFAIALDIYSGILVIFYCMLIGLIAVFSRRYLHRDPGYFRFYFFLNLFGAGVQTILIASSLGLLIVGWELVGVASAMLISFFYERNKPVEHGLRAFFTYRVCDVGFVIALLLLHTTHSSAWFNLDSNPAMQTLGLPPGSGLVFAVGLALVWAAAGKSAQLPFSGWLPRAMEGPTPSSAIFYGAISVHLGAFLLLRCAALIEESAILKAVIIVIAFITAIHSTLIGRVQTDIKSSLAYASLTQVSVIWIEIALGFYALAVLHMIGHGAVRSLQILKSPSALHDHQHLEEALGSQIPAKAKHLETLVPKSLHYWLYRQSLDRGFAEAIIRNGLFLPVTNVLGWFEKLDQQWIGFINKTSKRVKG